MLRLTVSTEEYLMIGEDIKLVFLGGTGKHLRIMVDAPKDRNIIRSTVLERNITDPEERAKLPRYYAQEEHPEKYVKKGNPGKSAEAASKAKEDNAAATGRHPGERNNTSVVEIPGRAKEGVSNTQSPKTGQKSRIIITRGNAGGR